MTPSPPLLNDGSEYRNLCSFHACREAPETIDETSRCEFDRTYYGLQEVSVATLSVILLVIIFACTIPVPVRQFGSVTKIILPVARLPLRYRTLSAKNYPTHNTPRRIVHSTRTTQLHLFTKFTQTPSKLF